MRTWTDDEVALLAEMVEAGKSWVEISRRLGKAAWPCRYKALREGLIEPKGRLWTEEEKELLRDCVETGMKPAEAARQLRGRSSSTVAGMIRRLYAHETIEQSRERRLAKLYGDRRYEDAETDDGGPIDPPPKTDTRDRSRELFLAVIELALSDAVYDGDDCARLDERIAAREWFERGDEDFHLICELAGVHPDEVRMHALQVMHDEEARRRWLETRSAE